MNRIAIKPHKNRGNEIIKIFENRGFKNPSKYSGNYSENITKDFAFIGGCDGAENCIVLTDIVYLENIGYKIYTLEEYEADLANIRILDKVEKYLRDNIILYTYATTVYQQEEWFNNFRKAMEEEINDCKKCSLTRNSTRCLFMDYCPHNKQKK